MKNAYSFLPAFCILQDLTITRRNRFTYKGLDVLYVHVVQQMLVFKTLFLISVFNVVVFLKVFRMMLLLAYLVYSSSDGPWLTIILIATMLAEFIIIHDWIAIYANIVIGNQIFFAFIKAHSCQICVFLDILDNLVQNWILDLVDVVLSESWIWLVNTHGVHELSRKVNWPDIWLG